MTNAALINNRYRILETLGRGGFGETYLVEDMHMPSGRKCVLKQLKPIVEQSKIPLWMKERFQREAAILEELGAASEQIPELYAYFSEQNQFYLVQELIKGETLGQKWSQEGNLSSQAVIAILQQILPILDFIHSRNIVHRDIKPENIILRNADNLPILIDFGAVKETLATAVERQSDSTLSAAIGTPGYMASEQAAGRPVYSSDLYSLGLTAIFLLTGKAPQELEIDPQTGEILWQKHAQEIDPQLVEILNRAIRFHPRDRFAQAKEMLTALENSYGDRQTQGVTRATVKVSPAVSHRDRDNFGGTVEYNRPQARKIKSGGSWLTKIIFFFLIIGGATLGTLAMGFYAISNWLQSRPQPSPQVKVEPDIPKPILLPKPEKTASEKPPEEEQPEVVVEEPEIEPETPQIEQPEVTKEKPSIPEIVIQPKPEPKPTVRTPILTTGGSESQLVSTLGKPTLERNNPQRNSKILIYRDADSGTVNATYHASNDGKIKQADVALSQELSLGTMQETLTKLLAGKAPADAKNKLRDVYNRKSDLYSFRVGNKQGRIYRDSKDRVNISVWE